ncbi:MAG TPA: lantibiotic dehydratase, partial [Jiangellaceae bacterium]
MALRSAGFPASKVDAVTDVDLGDQVRKLRAALRQQRTRTVELGGRVESANVVEPEAGILEPLNSLIRANEIGTLEHVRQAEQRTKEKLYAVARDELFQEAVLWQNRQAYQNAILPLADGKYASDNARSRSRRLWLAMHLQRYALKNDTIGFFGPIAWANVDPGTAHVTCRLGRTLLRDRAVHFEAWAVDQLARSLERQPAIHTALRPRRRPSSAIIGGTLFIPGHQPLNLTSPEELLLRAADGTRTVQALTSKLADTEAFPDRTSVSRCLESLRKRNMIVYGFDIPLATDAETLLQEQLSDLPEPIGAVADRTVAALSTARDQVALAAGAPGMLNTALERLENTFTRLTGQEAARLPGEIYAGRTLVYEDCIRNVDVTLGTDFLNAIGPPLNLVLHVGRWCTYRLAALARVEIENLFARLATHSRSGRVQAVDIWRHIPEIFPWLGTDTTTNSSLTSQLQQELQERMTNCIELPEKRRVQLKSGQLQARFMEQFAAPAPGWPHARFHSPDVMIAASSTEAIKRGDYSLVLGEVHFGTNTLLGAGCADTHPDREAMFARYCQDLPANFVQFTPSQHWRGITTRTRAAFNRSVDWHVQMSDELPAGIERDSSRLVSLAELVFERDDRSLRVRTYDQRLDVDVIEFFGSVLELAVADSFGHAFAGEHIPRITIDKFVIQREAWRVPIDCVELSAPSNRDRTYLNVIRWAEQFGLPDRTFYRVATEGKPIFLDLSSPQLVSLFAKHVRHAKRAGATTIRVTEMLPQPDQLWLTDGD